MTLIKYNMIGESGENGSQKCLETKLLTVGKQMKINAVLNA